MTRKSRFVATESGALGPLGIVRRSGKSRAMIKLVNFDGGSWKEVRKVGLESFE